MENRDPLFLACFNGDHSGYKDDSQFTLTDPQGNLLLRTNEQLLTKFEGDFMMLRFPEQRWLINNETIQNWTIYITSERIVGIKKILFAGAFEFFDHLETYGKFAGLHPTEEITIKQFFAWLGKGDKNLAKFSAAFQIAYTRLSSVSCLKLMGTDVSAVDLWYDDAPGGSQTEIQIHPHGMNPRQIYDLGVQIQGLSLKEKELCLIKKHELEPMWEQKEFNTYLAAIQRLVKAPDFLAMGSGTLDSESWDPISFQPHVVVWAEDVFARSFKGPEPVRIVNLSY
jgi:hypothetical protein